jgi:hypothetical protein
MDKGRTRATLLDIFRSWAIASRAREGDDDARDEMNLYIDMMYVVLTLMGRGHDLAICVVPGLGSAGRGGVVVVRRDVGLAQGSMSELPDCSTTY